MPGVYLAGPDVFLPDAVAWMERKKAICAGYHLTGVSPLDALAEQPADWAALPEWRRIALRNEAHIRGCQAIVANLTPFRGPSADVGTVYEVGFARGLGLKVFGYATVADAFLDRTLASIGGGRQDTDGAWWDPDGLLVEQFGLFDNLMIEGGIADSGTHQCWSHPAQPARRRLSLRRHACRFHLGKGGLIERKPAKPCGRQADA